ncbi:MAG: TusE/DsrC/DsvC family sulfur relay protein [Pseudomonadales bacterium]|nr:TusE/DsrC/DsvC family sulfur relay protein [Pseudomonadales bacterium]
MKGLPHQDPEGFLLNREDWTPKIAEALAAAEGRALTEDHRAVISLVQGFYDRYGIAPNNRALVRAVKATLDPALGSSVALMKLFGGAPAKTVAKYAGLAKPPHCL